MTPRSFEHRRFARDAGSSRSRSRRGGVSAISAAVASNVAIVLFAAAAHAQGVAVIAVAGANDSLPASDAMVASLVAALGDRTHAGASLARELNERFGAVPAAGDPLANARARADRARAEWRRASGVGDAAAERAAVEAANAAAQEMESQPAALEQSSDARRALEQALLFLAERYVAVRETGAATDVVLRLARVEPAMVFQAQTASPPLRQLYANVVQTMPRAALTVQSNPLGCLVLRDGREVGNAPVEMRDLAPGPHLIRVRCGAIESRVHRVTVAANTTATLPIDAQLDASLVTDGRAALRYPLDEPDRARAVADLAVLGRAVGARRVVGVWIRARRVVVVDPTAASEIGDAALEDDAHIVQLATRAAAPGGGPHAGAVHGDGSTGRSSTSSTGGSRGGAWTAQRAGARVDGGRIAAGLVLSAIAFGAAGAGIAFHVNAVSLWNRHAQNGSQVGTDTPQSYADYAESSAFFRLFELGAFVLAGGTAIAAVVTLATGASAGATHPRAGLVRVAPTVVPGGGFGVGLGGVM